MALCVWQHARVCIHDTNDHRFVFVDALQSWQSKCVGKRVLHHFRYGRWKSVAGHPSCDGPSDGLFIADSLATGRD